MQVEFFERNCCIRGYHDIDGEVWKVGFGEVLVCKGEPESASNRYTMAVKTEGTFIGYFLEALARLRTCKP